MKRGFPTAVFGVVALALVVREWNFDRQSHVAVATVLSSHTAARSGVTLADVVYGTAGHPVYADLRGWFRHFKPHEQVRIRYLPADPTDVVLDEFWQRHYASITALAIFAVLAAAELLAYRAWRRRQNLSLARDDYVPVLSASLVVPNLSIDTAPPLWDRDLDG
jgi:hypothetical protein